MKTYLKKIRDIQDECLGNHRDNLAISTLSGATIRSVEEGISFDEWKTANESIKGFFSEKKRFKEDSQKVVIEKNFFLNAITLTPCFFILRPIDEEGKTFIKLSDKFFSSIPKSKDSDIYLILLGLAGLILVIVGLVLVTDTYNFFYLFVILAGIIVIIGGFVIQNRIDKKDEKKYQAEKSAWEQNFTNRPSAVLKKSAVSFRESLGPEYTKAFINFDIQGSKFLPEYEAMVQKIASAAMQLKGKIVWLWSYGETTSFPTYQFKLSYLFKLTHYIENHLNLVIDINIKGGNLIPGIETDSSFIFFLNDYTDEMEKNFVPDHVYSMIQQKTENPGRTFKKDDMFIYRR